jgi:glycosyltransferase involved in cell wall biosynthesis
LRSIGVFIGRRLPNLYEDEARAQLLSRKEQDRYHRRSTPLRGQRDNCPVQVKTKRRPHVLTLTDVIGLGGAERIAEELCVLADPDRFRRSLCVTRPTAHVPGFEASLARLRDAGVDVVFLERRNRFDLRPLRRLVRVVRDLGVDVIHAHKFGSNVWAALLGHALGVPVVVAHEHTWSFEGQRARRLADRHLVARFSDAVIAVSEADRARMVADVGMPADRVVLIHNGIAEPEGGNENAVRRELDLAPGAPVLLQTATLRPQKAVEVMIGAMAPLRRVHPDVRLLVAGQGDVDRLQGLAAAEGVADAVSLLGPRRDVTDLLAAANVGVLSSDFEGMPLAVLEYMAAGLPVVATGVGGLPEIVREGETGFLVAPRDPAALAERISRLLADPALAREMGERGRRRQQEQFSSEVMVAAVTGLYERLLTAKGVSVPEAETTAAAAGPAPRP